MKPARTGDAANLCSIVRQKYLTEGDRVTQLHKACACGDLEQVTLLCDTSNIETPDKYNYRPVHVACIFGHLAVVKYLHQHGCDIEAPGNLGNRPLYLDATHGRLDMVKYLCSNQCEIDVPNNDSQRPIQLACRSRHTEILRYLREYECDKEAFTCYKLRPLHLACKYGHLEIVKFLCEQKCNFEASAEESFSPLHLACEYGHLEIVKFFCDQNCNIEAPSDVSFTPLHLACEYGHLEIVKFLCDQNCNIEAPSDFNCRPIHLACIHGHLEIVKFLCDQNCNIEAPSYNNYTPLHLACERGHLEIVKFLCKQKCNIEAITMFRYRPIHLAILKGHIDIVRYLCQQRCEIEAVTNVMGKSALDLAIQKGRHDIHKFLFNEIFKRQLVEEISNMKVECDQSCDHSSCFQSIYSKRSLIGRGGFGTVFKVKYPKPNCTLCVKSIYLNPGARSQKTKHIEFNIKEYLHILHHERIVQYYGMINTDKKMLIFMEYVEGISLEEHINKKPLPHNKVVQYSKGILEGLKFLHEKKIIHRNIKPQNIMLDTEEHVKLCDFGLSRFLESIEQSIHIQTAESSSEMTFCGTPNYMAPECVTGEKYSYPVDIWGLGASVVEMLTGVRPFHGMVYCAIIFHLGTKQKIEFIPAEPMSEDMKSFVDQMLCPCPSTRTTAEKLLKFIDDVFHL